MSVGQLQTLGMLHAALYINSNNKMSSHIVLIRETTQSYTEYDVLYKDVTVCCEGFEGDGASCSRKSV